MDPTHAAVEVAAVRCEQWIGASLRAERLRALTAASRTARRRRALLPRPRRARPGLLWMLAVSIVGYRLLR